MILYGLLLQIWAAWCESRSFMGLPTGSPFTPSTSPVGGNHISLRCHAFLHPTPQQSLSPCYPLGGGAKRRMTSQTMATSSGLTASLLQAVVDSFHNLTNIANCDGTKICNEDKLLYFGFAGVFTAAFDSGIEWLIVKGIADYAHSSCAQQNTKRWRRCASVMAASLVMHILIIPLYSVPGHIIKVILTQASFRGYSCRPNNLFVVLVLFPLYYPHFFSFMDLSFKSKARGAERKAFPIPNYMSQSLE